LPLSTTYTNNLGPANLSLGYTRLCMEAASFLFISCTIYCPAFQIRASKKQKWERVRRSRVRGKGQNLCLCGLGTARSTRSMQAHSVSCVSVPRSSGVTEANGAAHSDVLTRNNIEPCQNRPRLSPRITARRTRDLRTRAPRTLFRRTLALHIKALHTPGPRTLAPRTPAPLLLHASLFCIFSQ